MKAHSAITVAWAGRPGVRTGYKEQLYKGPAVITGDQRRWGIWAAGCGGQNNASLDQHSSMRSSNYNAAPFEALNMRGGPCSFAR
jgi:hypothetical protein